MAMNWNNYEVKVNLKLVNQDFLRNCSEHEEKLRSVFAKNLNLLIKTNSTVAQAKDMVDEKLRQLLPKEVAFDIIELRIGERLSLPNTGDLAQLI